MVLFAYEADTDKIDMIDCWNHSSKWCNSLRGLSSSHDISWFYDRPVGSRVTEGFITLHWAVCCFDAAIYSQLSILDVAPQPLYSSCQFRLNGECGQHTCSQTRSTLACLESHIDQLIRWTPSIIRLLFAFIFTRPVVSFLASLQWLHSQSCGAMMSCGLSARPIPRCRRTVVIHFAAAPSHDK